MYLLQTSQYASAVQYMLHDYAMDERVNFFSLQYYTGPTLIQ